MEIRKKEIPFERVLFFSDAIVAIAITLLALDLKLEFPENHHLTFQDLLVPWKNYLAFLLSFINIASFWRTHHQMYIHIAKMNEHMMTYTICWLFFIVTLPFSTSVLSTHFGDPASIFLYSVNILALSVCQNFIWHRADVSQNFIEADKTSMDERKRFRLMFNLDMANALVCVVLSFFVPKISFFLLFFKIPVLFFVSIYIAREKSIKLKAKNKQ